MLNVTHLINLNNLIHLIKSNVSQPIQGNPVVGIWLQLSNPQHNDLEESNLE